MIVEIPISLIQLIPAIISLLISIFWFIVGIYERMFIILGIGFLIGAFILSGIIELEFKIVNDLHNSTGFN